MWRSFRLVAKKSEHRDNIPAVTARIGEAGLSVTFFLLGGLLGTLVVAWHTTELPWLGRSTTPWGFWFALALSASFLVIGAAGVVRILYLASTSAERRSAIANKARLEIGPVPSSSARLDSTLPARDVFLESPGVRFPHRLPIDPIHAAWIWTQALFVLVWNGVGLFLWVRQLAILFEGRFEWLPTFFLLPFSAVGLWAVFVFARSFLRLVAIGPTIVELEHHPIHGGDRVAFFLTQGGHFVLQTLTVELVCEEQASFHQGTHIRTERQIVLRQTLLEDQDVKVQPDAPLERDGLISLPEGVMHSFRSRSHAVRYLLVVSGKPRSWPAWTRTFTILVYPEHLRPQERTVARRPPRRSPRLASPKSQSLILRSESVPRSPEPTVIPSPSSKPDET